MIHDLSGHADATIDKKLRLAVPSKHRHRLVPDEQTKGVVVALPWDVGSERGVIKLFPEEAWAVLAGMRTQSLTPDPDVAEMEADLFGLGERLELDSAGRVTLPKLHVELTKLDSEVVVLGVGNRLEIHDRASWHERMQERFRKLPSLVAKTEKRAREQNG